MPRPHLVLLLGMHRSGTSLGAQALARAGLPMGPALMTAPSPDNLDGYWEDADIVRVQDELLTAAAGEPGGIWSAGFLGLDTKAISPGLMSHAEEQLAAILT